MKKTTVFLLTIMAATMFSAVAIAADGDVTTTAIGAISTIATVAGFAITIGIFGPSLGQGLAVYGATTGIARNPEAAGTIRLTMIIGLALIESLAIYALVVVLLLLYAFPYSDLLIKFLS